MTKLKVTGVETIELIDPRNPRKDLTKLQQYKGQKLTAREILAICGYAPTTAMCDARVRHFVKYIGGQLALYLVK